MDLLPQIEGVLESKGHTVPRPQYDKKAKTVKEEDDAQDDGPVDEDVEDEEEASKHRGKLDKFKMKKQNHEATSEEDEG